jgi:hypothetical protein
MSSRWPIEMMKSSKLIAVMRLLSLLAALSPSVSTAWYDETHLAVAKVAGYKKWFNAAGADVARIKLGDNELHNHYVNNPRGAVITPETVLAQVDKYNQIDPSGHLYGAIIASARDYINLRKEGRFAEHLLAYTIHYIGDLSQPLHHTLYGDFNKQNHAAVDGVVNDEVLENLDKIKLYPIEIKTEQDLAREIARTANLSLSLGYRLEDQGRLLTKEEAYQQLSHSASLLKAVLRYVGATVQY